LFAGIAAALGAFLVALLIPASEHALWANAPLAGWRSISPRRRRVRV
jgi:hypothetical protein